METFFRLDGQICIVTGAGSETGIGFATAKILGLQGARRVIITGTTDRIIRRATELGNLGITADGYRIDLTDRPSVRLFVDEIVRKYGRIDVLVNNAGMVQVGMEEDYTLFHELSDESFDDAIRRNLMTAYNTSRAVADTMIRQNYGRVIHVSSTTGPLGANPGEVGYATAKAAMLGLCKGMALELAPYRITVNNVLPGWVATGSQTPKEARAGQATPIGRSARPEEVGHMIAFLASREASYITGQDFVVDGGNSIVENKAGE